jgi:nucleoside-diphosphate-sugar epimerase
MKKEIALTTGSTGLIGRELDRYLPTNLSLLPISRRMPHANTESSEFFADLETEEGLHHLPASDYILHLAQNLKYRNFPKDTSAVFNLQVKATNSLLQHGETCGLKKFVLASTGGVYHFSGETIHEDSRLKTLGEVDYYYGTKMASEFLALSYAKLFDVNIIRPFFVFGPDQDMSMLIPRLVQSIFLGKSISLAGSSGISINPIYSLDAAEIVMNLLQMKNSEIVNLCGPEVVSIRQICEIISDRIGIQAKFIVNEDQKDIVSSCDRSAWVLRRDFTGLQSALETTVDGVMYRLNK